MVDEDAHGRYDLGAGGMAVEALRPSTRATARTHSRAGTAVGRGTTASGPSRLPTANGAATPYPIVVITENRAREVGLAYVNLSCVHTLELMQLADNHSYTQTLALLHVLAPVEIVISRSQVDRLLFQKIIAQWGSDANALRTQISAINRKFFDEVSGELVATELSCRPLQPDVTAKYLALASLAALVKYVESMQRIHFAKKTMNIVARESTGRMSIDFETLKSLEVLRNARTGDVKQSLLGIIDHTETDVGLRLLRAQLINPVNDAATLAARLDAVDELLAHDSAFFSIQSALKPLPRLDTLLSLFAYIPKVATPRTAQQAIQALLTLKFMIDSMPRIQGALGSLRSSLLVAVRDNLNPAVMRDIHSAIDEIIVDEATYVSYGAAMRQQEVAAVRGGLDGTLDAMRKIYSDCIQEIHELAESYKTEWGVPVKLAFTVTRGYHLLLPATMEAVPDSVIQPVRNKTNVTCTTETLASLNDRMKESLLNIYILTNTAVQELMNFVRQHMHYLYKFTESIAMLDMIASFAAIVVTSPRPDLHARPTFSENGPLLIVQGRHPLVEASRDRPFVPNDCFMNQDANLLLLTGPNCSGKSTLLRQIAIVVLLAHIGCYVPATSACIRLTDRICTRMGTSDDMEANASTFLKEMKEAAFILEQVKLPVTAVPTSLARASDSATRGDRVLVLLDELGRGTSNEDGVGIAWSICEQLLMSNAHTVVATHYHELSELTAVYPQARAYSMRTEVSQGDAAGLSFTYTLSEGSSPHRTDYGILLAEMAGLPKALVDDARMLKEVLSNKLAPRPRTGAPPSRAGTAQPRLHTASHAVDMTPQRISTAASFGGSVALGPAAAQLMLSVAQRRLVADVATRLCPIADATSLDDPAVTKRVRDVLQGVYNDYALQITALSVSSLQDAQADGSPETLPATTPGATADSADRLSVQATVTSGNETLLPLTRPTTGAVDTVHTSAWFAAVREPAVDLLPLLSAAAAPNAEQALQGPTPSADQLLSVSHVLEGVVAADAVSREQDSTSHTASSATASASYEHEEAVEVAASNAVASQGAAGGAAEKHKNLRDIPVRGTSMSARCLLRKIMQKAAVQQPAAAHTPGSFWAALDGLI